jgi:integrase
MPKPSRVTLTQRLVRETPAPPRGRVYVHDAKVPHLSLCITAAGARTYYRTGRIAGKPERIRLGTIDELTVDEARKAVATITGRVAAGEDPHAGRKRKGRTLGELWAWYFEHHSKPHKDTWQADERRWKRELARWSTRPLDGITIEDVQQRVSEVAAAKGPYAGNKVRELLRHMYAVATTIGWTSRNPVTAVRRYKTKGRVRYLEPSEVARFFAALDGARTQQFKDYVRLCVFTGARRSNVGAMRREHVDLDAAVWAIPAEIVKTEEPLVVVLPPAAVDVLRRRRAERPGDSGWEFPSDSATGHYTWPAEAWDTLLVRGGFAKYREVTRTIYGKPRKKREVYDRTLRLHDLRRTLGSWQANAMIPLNVIGQSLGHKSLASTQIYARLQVAPVRAAVEQAAAAIQAAAEGKSAHGPKKSPKTL